MLLPSSTTYLIAPLYFTSLPFTLLLISFFTIIFFNKINYILMIFWNVVKKIKITSDLINLADNIYKARNIIKKLCNFFVCVNCNGYPPDSIGCLLELRHSYIVPPLELCIQYSIFHLLLYLPRRSSFYFF